MSTERIATRGTSVVDPTGEDSDTSPLKVLVVDDSKLQRMIVKNTVKQAGYRVVEADSGNTALDVCKAEQPDIILSDWMMPGMNGLEFCQHYRDWSGDNYGYFILLTSKSDKVEVAQGLDAGADDFLTKPVNAHELRARITAGERILKMQRELSAKNTLISETLAELQRVYDSLDKDLIEAKQLQQSLIPERVQNFDTADLTLFLKQSGHVGGDLVGFFPAEENRLGLYSIDVSGHGISSALMTARLAGYLSPNAPDQNVALERLDDGTYRARPPGVVIAELNNLVLNEMDTEHYFTLLLANVDLSTGHVIMSQAGHPHPVIQRADGSIEQEGPGGFPVGLMGDLTFTEFETDLRPGDRLLVMSDGVIECPNPAGKMLEEEGLAELMTELSDITGPAFFEALMWKLSDFTEEQPFPDDVSGVLYEHRG